MRYFKKFFLVLALIVFSTVLINFKIAYANNTILEVRRNIDLVEGKRRYTVDITINVLEDIKNTKYTEGFSKDVEYNFTVGSYRIKDSNGEIQMIEPAIMLNNTLTKVDNKDISLGRGKLKIKLGDLKKGDIINIKYQLEPEKEKNFEGGATAVALNDINKNTGETIAYIEYEFDDEEYTMRLNNLNFDIPRADSVNSKDVVVPGYSGAMYIVLVLVGLIIITSFFYVAMLKKRKK